MTHKNNSLWRFLFSLIPGAGEMYMGFFKAGTSLMSLFFFFIFAAASIGFGELLIIDVIVWFYSFFHVHNLAAMPDEEFYVVEDNYLFSLENVLEKGRSFFASSDSEYWFFAMQTGRFPKPIDVIFPSCLFAAGS